MGVESVTTGVSVTGGDWLFGVGEGGDTEVDSCLKSINAVAEN